MWSKLGFDPASLVIMAGALLGGVMRSLITKDQAFLSKRTLVDTVTSGAAGLVLIGSGLLPGDWTPAAQAALVLIVSYVSSDLVTTLVGRFNLLSPPQTRRVEDRKD